VQEQLTRTKEKKNAKDLSHLVKLCHAGLELLEGYEPESMLRELGSLDSVGIKAEAIGVHHCAASPRNQR
jgi:hypothetical protein